MIKYSVCTLNKLIATHVWQEDQNPKLSPSLWYRPLTLLVWHVRLCSSKAWGSGSCKTLSLMFPVIHDHERLKLPLSITPPSQSSNFTSYLSRWGEVLEFLRNTSGCSEGWSFEEMSNKSVLTVTRTDVWWYCGGPLLETLPVKWSDTCTLVQLAIPFTLAFQKTKSSSTKDLVSLEGCLTPMST
jgi:hypothetical protein